MMRRTVTITLDYEHAERISDRLSDMGCWLRGFTSALGPDDSERWPMGRDGLTDIQIVLKGAIADADAAHEAERVKSFGRLQSDLDEIGELVDGEVDIDNSGGPNKAMKILRLVNEMGDLMRLMRP